MKNSSMLFAITALVLGALSGAALADEIDITQALIENTDIENVAHDLSLGNASSGHLAEATASWTPGEETITLRAKLRLHNKHQQCVLHNCWDIYNYWVNIRVEAELRDCRVARIDVSSENELYKIPAELATVLGSMVNGLRGGTVLKGMPGCD